MQPHKRHIALELLSDAVRDSPDGVRLQVRGFCMVPLVQDGDFVHLVPLTAPPHRGDLVLARDGRDQLVCHRILGRHGNRWRLAGDRTFAVEDHSTESLLGRVVSIERQPSVAPRDAPSQPLDLRRRSAVVRRLDTVFAAWHELSYSRRGRPGGRLLEALRWRLVVLWHRWMWRFR